MLNIQGISTKRTNKLLSPEIKDIFNNHDIVLFTETWANQFSDLTVEHFEHFNLNRSENKASSKRSSGGIIIYVRNEFVSSDTVIFHSEDDIICIKINGFKLGLHNDLFVCLCYIIPEKQPTNHDRIQYL